MNKIIVCSMAFLALGLGSDAYNVGVKGGRYTGGGQSFGGRPGGGIQTLPGSIGGGHGGGIQTLPGSIGGGHGGGGIQTLPGSIGGGHGGGIQTLPGNIGGGRGIQTLPARLPGGTSGFPGASKPYSQTRPLPRPGHGSGSRYVRPVRPGYSGSKGGRY